MSEPTPKLPPLQRLCDVCQGRGYDVAPGADPASPIYDRCERCHGSASVPTEAGAEILRLVAGNLELILRNIGTKGSYPS